jgi:hypothetical protein
MRESIINPVQVHQLDLNLFAVLEAIRDASIMSMDG